MLSQMPHLNVVINIDRANIFKILAQMRSDPLFLTPFITKVSWTPLSIHRFCTHCITTWYIIINYLSIKMTLYNLYHRTRIGLNVIKRYYFLMNLTNLVYILVSSCTTVKVPQRKFLRKHRDKNNLFWKVWCIYKLPTKLKIDTLKKLFNDRDFKANYIIGRFIQVKRSLSR